MPWPKRQARAPLPRRRALPFDARGLTATVTAIRSRSSRPSAFRDRPATPPQKSVSTRRVAVMRRVRVQRNEVGHEGASPAREPGVPMVCGRPARRARAAQPGTFPG